MNTEIKNMAAVIATTIWADGVYDEAEKVSVEEIAEAFEKCRKARLHILDDIMAPVIEAPRAELSKYAPKMKSMKIDPEKIKDVIGKGGKVIQKICAECDCKVDVSEDGSVFVSAIDIDNARREILAKTSLGQIGHSSYWGLERN